MFPSNPDRCYNPEQGEQLSASKNANRLVTHFAAGTWSSQLNRGYNLSERQRAIVQE